MIQSCPFLCIKLSYPNYIELRLFTKHEYIDCCNHNRYKIQTCCQQEELTIANYVLHQSG